MFWPIMFYVAFFGICAFKAWQWWHREQRQKNERARGETSFGEILLTRDHIVQHGREFQPLSGVTATIESVGQLQRRITATRLATLGVFAVAMQKKTDDRALYMTISGPTFEWLIDLDPDNDYSARRFAAAINQAGRVSH